MRLVVGLVLLLVAGTDGTAYLQTCIDACTAQDAKQSFPIIEACFADGYLTRLRVLAITIRCRNTYNITLSSLGSCYFGCGVGVRWLGVWLRSRKIVRALLTASRNVRVSE